VRRLAVGLLALAGCAGARDSKSDSVAAVDDLVDVIAYTKLLSVEEVTRNWDARFGPLPPGYVATEYRFVLPEFGIDSRIRFTVSWECVAEHPREPSVGFITVPLAPDAIGPWNGAPPIVDDSSRGEPSSEWRRIRLLLTRDVVREIRGFLDSSTPLERERAGERVAYELLRIAIPGIESRIESIRRDDVAAEAAPGANSK